MISDWTPGIYIQRRRMAAGLSIDDVAALISTEPHAISERERRLWLMRIEADQVPIPDNIGLLRAVFRFDPQVLAALVEFARNPENPFAPRLCHVCGCSQRDACVSDDGAACGWAGQEDLCTRCELAPAVHFPISGASAC